MAIVILGSLNEIKLAAAVRELAGNDWAGCQVRLPGSPHRWDMGFRLRRLEVLVEFDGDEHYRNSLKVKIDGEKDLFARGQNHRVVRIPYWIQLNQLTAQHYFGLSAEIEQDFQHGFITTKLFPASFCESGLRIRNRALQA